MKNNRKGFTLIELLIVVAIIAILAAIAIPNFLAAQTRAKVSRCKNDLRTLHTGMESYYVDENAYVPEHLDMTSNEQARHLKIYTHLTTPIAYITAIPVDPFKSGMRDGTSYVNNPYYWYYNWLSRYGHPIDLVKDWGWDPWYDGQSAAIMISIGPSFKTVASTSGTGFGTYDPSNGTVSPGYIYRLLPGGKGN
jgi:prepilin-type N-terminal cleavage/methylation domain-containing protein